jgi:predicted metal-dependent peptidase
VTPLTAEELEAEARRLSSLRTQMLEAHPFWGYLLLQVKLVPCETLPTFAGTDCIHHVWYNPRLTRQLSPAQLGFVLAHEIGHQLLASEDRRRGRQLHLWNCATDYAINRIVSDIEAPGGLSMYDSPDGTYEGLGEVTVLDEGRFDGMIAETIYETLAEEQLRPPVTIELVLDGEDGSFTVPCLAHGGLDVHLPEGLSERSREELRERLAGAVETWRSMGERGSVPDDVVRRVELGRGRVPWQRVFRHYAGLALARDEYALTRPSRRYQLEDIVVPGLIADRLGHVVVALDTSASMTPEILGMVASEISHLAREVEAVTLIVADRCVHEVVPYHELEPYLKRGRYKGGGGTNHNPVFEHITRNRLEPDLFIGLTDLASRFPEHEPGYPVVWVVPPAHDDAPWGRVVVVE